MNPQAIDKIIKKNKAVGLSDPALDENLKAGEYKAVLKKVWGERDRTIRLQWLENKSNELHPVLMFELAVAKFVASPTIETINLVSIPLIKAASFRVSQDAQCSKDPSVKNGDAATRMSMTYQQRLEKLIQSNLGCSLEKVVSENQDIRVAAIRSQVLETARLSLSSDLPSPDWIGWHGMAWHERIHFWGPRNAYIG